MSTNKRAGFAYGLEELDGPWLVNPDSLGIVVDQSCQPNRVYITNPNTGLLMEVTSLPIAHSGMKPKIVEDPFCKPGRVYAIKTSTETLSKLGPPPIGYLEPRVPVWRRVLYRVWAALCWVKRRFTTCPYRQSEGASTLRDRVEDEWVCSVCGASVKALESTHGKRGEQSRSEGSQ